MQDELMQYKLPNTNNIKLNFNHPLKELAWFSQKKQCILTRQIDLLEKRNYFNFIITLETKAIIIILGNKDNKKDTKEIYKLNEINELNELVFLQYQ